MLQNHTEQKDIIVCVKQVPDTQEIRIDPETGTLIREGVPSILNPFDEYALNLAIEIRDRFMEDSEIIALSMGPMQAGEALRKCLAIGADSAILLSDRAFAGADTYATAHTLATAIKRITSSALILCGYEALDGNTAQVGPELAELLSIPAICYVESIVKIEDNSITCKRESENGYELLKSPVPALLTCMTTPDFEPKLPGVREIMAARRKKLEVWSFEALGGSKDEYGLRGSLTRVTKSYTPEIKRKGIRFEGKDGVKALVDALSGTI
jgi:electron transfer flavoprotein beta subunit